MTENTISVTMRNVAGGGYSPLLEASPKQALDHYFMPDMSPPVSVLIIEATDKEGKRVKLYITDSDVSFDIG